MPIEYNNWNGDHGFIKFIPFADFVEKYLGVTAAQMTIRSDWNYTKVIINGDIQEVKEFRTCLMEMHANDESVGSLAPSLTPPGDKLQGWFDKVTCVGCDELAISSVLHRLQEMLQKENTAKPLVDLTLSMDELLSLKRKCVLVNVVKTQTFKVSVLGADKTDDDNSTASFTLFQSQVVKYVTKSAYQLYKMLPEGQDQPVEFDALIGNILFFKVEVNNYTLIRDNPVYTVKDATGDPVFIEKFTEEYLKFKLKSLKTTNEAAPSQHTSLSKV
ncbi:uncharacterized protein [Rutidosis leptorrhynchoides]|uniref:uncharacterized protein n=1 Tax=Rutidosis leptorrhynchoides TaxID=125765 RepID=UPI003A99043D